MRRIQYLVILTIFVFHFTALLAIEPITVESLLNEMVNRDTLAQYPKTNFKLKQASSYSRKSKTPQDPKDWFSNHDCNHRPSDQNFVRIEENNGEKEWVLMEHQGAGAIVRSWMPFKKAPKGVMIRFYLDGSAKPALEGNVCSLLNGEGLIPFPFAHKSLLSAVSFYPIPYAKSCKVTMTGEPFFFQFTYREYLPDTPVKTFSMKDFETAKLLANYVGKKLLTPPSDVKEGIGFTANLGKKEVKSIELPAGTFAVRELKVKLGKSIADSVTRSLVLKIEFDGKETVWTPVGDFFGTGIGIHPFQDWNRTVLEDGTMTCRWVMPYQKSGKISLVNFGEQSVKIELEAKTGAWKWNENSLYFHANWRGQYPVPTRPYSDWNYLNIKGRGVYVGDTLTVFNPVDKWWGEGDEKIFVDGESFPSMFGTGTEDYYGYSWGGTNTDFYEHPFHAQPRANLFDKLHRKSTDKKSTKGFSTETRVRSLDVIPFDQSLQLDMEVWAWEDCHMAYGVGLYWYGDTTATSNRVPDPQGILIIPDLKKDGIDGKRSSVPLSLFSPQ